MTVTVLALEIREICFQTKLSVFHSKEAEELPSIEVLLLTRHPVSGNFPMLAESRTQKIKTD